MLQRALRGSHSTLPRTWSPTVVGLVVGWALWLGAMPGLPLGESRAEGERQAFVLGLRDKALRTPDGARALEERLRARLSAAHLFDHRTRIDREHGEVWIEVASDMTPDALQTLLIARGEASFVPVGGGGELLADLRDSLPGGVELVYGRGPREVDLYLFSPDREPLERYVAQLALGEYRVVVGPTGRGDVEQGFRTYLIPSDGKTLGLNGLEAVQVHDGVFPNYHWVRAFWTDLDQIEVEGRLAGRAGLQTFTEGIAPGRMLLSVDGRVWASIGVHRPQEDGQLSIQVSAPTAQLQRDTARLIAAFLADDAHPCEIVVVATGARALPPDPRRTRERPRQELRPER